MWKKFKQRFFYVVLSVIILWLIGGLVLHLKGKFTAASWSGIFLLKDYPLWSVTSLLLLGLIYWIFRDRQEFKLHNDIRQNTILLSTTFYIGLLIALLLFPRLTGYSFQSDWSLMLVATIPLIALFILLLIERATSVKAKFVGVEVEFQQAIDIPRSQTVTLEREVIAKEEIFDIKRITKKIQAKQKTPHILIVPISSQPMQMPVEFLALRLYVYELSAIAPLQYIVFTDENEKYLGFMTVELFKTKYPRFVIEMLLEDFDREEWDDDRFYSNLLELPIYRAHRELLNRLRGDLVRHFWSPGHNQGKITRDDLDRLGAKKIFLQKPTVVEAYKKMVEYKVSGIPVVDEGQKFLGITTKDRVIQEVMIQLLEKRSSSK